MIQCSDCEFFSLAPDGKPKLLCNPYSNIKEPDCLVKWQLVKLDTMVEAYMSTVEIYRRLAPLQERMFRHMEQELDDADQADAWKYASPEEDNDEEEDEPPPDDGLRY